MASVEYGEASTGVLGTAAQGPCDPSFRIRVSLPGMALARYGIEMHSVPLMSFEQAQRFRTGTMVGKAAIIWSARGNARSKLRRLPPRVDTVLMQRRMDLAPTVSLERVAVRNRRLVYDVDDAIWLSGRQTGGRRSSIFKGAGRKVAWLARRADHVIAGNRFLAERLGEYAERLTVVPSLIDTDAYGVRQHSEESSITLGWIGSPTTAEYLRQLMPMLERFAREHPRPVRVIVVGARVGGSPYLQVEARPWSSETEQAALAELDIGLMPLPDTEWARGKCAYKAIQYMAGGVPTVADDVGVSSEVINDGGCVVRSSDAWVEALKMLAGDHVLRQRLGIAGRARVEREFSFARWLPVLAAILRGGSGSTQRLDSGGRGLVPDVVTER